MASIATLITALLVSLAAAAQSPLELRLGQRGHQYEVTITNLSPGQTFTPQLVVTHSPNSRFVQGAEPLFELGEPASEVLEILAEDGDTAPLMDSLANFATDMITIDGLLGPGQSSSVVIRARPRDRLSVAAMLIPTNDTFMALLSMELPIRRGREAQMQVPAYDAGTEANDQNCQNMPGPRCAGEGYSPGPNEGDEGFVHISNGFHDLGDSGANGGEVLAPATYDWRNPVARITVTRK